MQVGFIGTGTIAAAVVEGLSRRSPTPDIMVSPRSEAVSGALAARFANVRRTASNAEVATADLVFLAVRPTQVDEALRGIAFRSDQIVLSLVAGLPLDEVRKLAPLARVDRVLPMPGIARREGPITVYPGLPEVIDLLGPLGDLLVSPTEAALGMGGLSAFMSSYFELQATLVKTAIGAGASEEDARNYVTSLLSMLAATARQAPGDRFDTLAIEHQTQGGLNERVRGRLLQAGWFDMPAKMFDEIDTLTWRSFAGQAPR